MKLQDVFNKFWKVFVVKKAKKSGFDGLFGICVYHPDINGYGCAIGCAVPDGEYRDSWEGRNVKSLIDNGEMPFIQDPENAGIYRELQDLHDKDENWNLDGSLKEDAARFFAGRHNLTIP